MHKLADGNKYKDAQMKVGDLVKFKDHLRGEGRRHRLRGLIGIIVAENGDGFDILWNNPARRGWGGHKHGLAVTELAEFLEEVNESQ